MQATSPRSVPTDRLSIRSTVSRWFSHLSFVVRACAAYPKARHGAIFHPSGPRTTPRRRDPVAVAKALLAERNPSAAICFLAGSVVRGYQTATSDLDIVVVSRKLPNAYRESLVWSEWPVEVFVHDTETLRYFCEQDCQRVGVPTLPAMVSEGIELPKPSDVSKKLNAYVRDLLEAGPIPWREREVNDSRYSITDLIGDMKAPRSLDELHVCAARLYPLIADHYLRSRQLWSARGKSIPRRLQAVSPTFGEQFREAFRDVFERCATDRLVALCEEVLAPKGGWLFAGYTIQAPSEWRIKEGC